MLRLNSQYARNNQHYSPSYTHKEQAKDEYVASSKFYAHSPKLDGKGYREQTMRDEESHRKIDRQPQKHSDKYNTYEKQEYGQKTYQIGQQRSYEGLKLHQTTLQKKATEPHRVYQGSRQRNYEHFEEKPQYEMGNQRPYELNRKRSEEQNQQRRYQQGAQRQYGQQNNINQYQLSKSTQYGQKRFQQHQTSISNHYDGSRRFEPLSHKLYEQQPQIQTQANDVRYQRCLSKRNELVQEKEDLGYRQGNVTKRQSLHEIKNQQQNRYNGSKNIRFETSTREYTNPNHSRRNEHVMRKLQQYDKYNERDNEGYKERHNEGYKERHNEGYNERNNQRHTGMYNEKEERQIIGRKPVQSRPKPTFTPQKTMHSQFQPGSSQRKKSLMEKSQMLRQKLNKLTNNGENQKKQQYGQQRSTQMYKEDQKKEDLKERMRSIVNRNEPTRVQSRGECDPLNKISLLNDRINERIQSIISNFGKNT